LKKAHIRLMRHPETCLYSGVLLLGKNEVVDDVPTACTDGFNKRYGSKFLSDLSLSDVAGLVLHENLHVMLKHIPRHRDLAKEDMLLLNCAMDYVVNDVIMNLQDKTLATLPKGGLYDPKYHNWDVRRVYDDLKKQQKEGGGGKGNKPSGGNQNGSSNGNKPLDEHDFSGVEELSEEQTKEVVKKIEQAIREGGMLAGKFGVKLPRVIEDSLQPKVDWRHELREFISSMVRGATEYSWHRMNRRRLVDNLYLPSIISEQIGGVVIAIDTSGSIGGAQLSEFAAELAGICEACEPEMVRVLWWDTVVHGEQVFTGNYSAIRNLLKPLGGGGTRVSSVRDYMIEQKINADCLVVLTDGYVEHDIHWEGMTVPSLWVVTQNDSMEPPIGARKVKWEK